MTENEWHDGKVPVQLYDKLLETSTNRASQIVALQKDVHQLRAERDQLKRQAGVDTAALNRLKAEQKQIADALTEALGFDWQTAYNTPLVVMACRTIASDRVHREKLYELELKYDVIAPPEQIMKKTFYLIIRADQTARIVTRARPASDEVAIPLVLDFPASWGRIMTERKIEIRVPDFLPSVEYTEPETTAEEGES